jgi:hypothetical protein
MEEKKKEYETGNILLPTCDEIEGVSVEGTVSFFPLSYEVFLSIFSLLSSCCFVFFSYYVHQQDESAS